MADDKKHIERRQPVQIERDRRNIAAAYLRGDIQADIAEALGLSQSTVSRDLKAIQEQWKHDAARDVGERKAQELAKIDTLEIEYWNAWRRSQEDAETVKQKGQAKGTEIATTDVEKTTKGQAGDPRFLQGVQWCIERRCKILGVDAPDKHEHAGPGGKPIPLEIIEKLTDDQLKRISAGENPADVIANPGASDTRDTSPELPKE